VYSSAIFYHFGGKEGLWIALGVELLEEANTAAASDLQAMPLGPERISKAVESYFMIGGPEVQSASFEMMVLTRAPAPALGLDELDGSAVAGA
jgi:AcrR family transcriptional regulator